MKIVKKLSFVVMVVLAILLFDNIAKADELGNNDELNKKVIEQTSKVLRTRGNANRRKGELVQEFQILLNEYLYGVFPPIAEDGVFGPATKKAAIRVWQMETNKFHNTGLDPDGIFGPKCKIAAKLVPIRDGANSYWHIYICSMMLEYHGFEAQATYFNTKIQKAIVDFQRSRGLAADGICGANTWHALFN